MAPAVVLWLETLCRVLATSLLLFVLDVLPHSLRQHLLPVGVCGRLFTGLRTVSALWRRTACNLRPTLRASELLPPVPVLLEHGDATELTLSDLATVGRPLLLAFGSCTCPPFLAALPALVALSSRYADRADCALVYVEEAHPLDGWRHDGVRHAIAQHTSLVQRRAAAATLKTELLCVGAAVQRLTLAVDLMGNATALAFGALPVRLALMLDGRLVWLGQRESANVNALQAALEETLRQLWPV